MHECIYLKLALATTACYAVHSLYENKYAEVSLMFKAYCAQDIVQYNTNDLML
jgi:hypothetical protein